MTIGSLNLARQNWSWVEDTLSAVSSLNLMALCVQEVRSWPLSDDASLPGWRLVHSASSPTAVLVSADMHASIRYTSAEFGNHTGVVLGPLGIISTYLPDSWKPACEFNASVVDLFALAADLRKHGAVQFVVCGDLQVELEPNISHFTGPSANGRPRTVEQLDRCHQLYSLMETYTMKAVNTFLPECACFKTRAIQGSERSTGKQLDYIFVSRCLKASSGVFPNRIGNSDHFLVWATIRPVHAEFEGLTKKARTVNTKGWTPIDEEQSFAFAQSVVERCCLSNLQLRDSMDMVVPTMSAITSLNLNLHDVSAAVENSALSIKYDCMAAQAVQHSRRPEALSKAVEKARDFAQPADERRKWRRIEKRERRKWNACKKLQRLKRAASRQTTTMLDMGGAMTEDRVQWKRAVQSFAIEKYHDDNFTVDDQRHLYQAVLSSGRALILDGRSPPQWPLSLTMECRSKMKTGRSSGPGDAIVSEMLLQIPWISLLLVHVAFLTRFFTPDKCGVSDTWYNTLILLIPKISKARYLKDFRGISLIDVLSKWYISCVVKLAERELQRHAQQRPEWREVLVFGFMEGHSCDQVAGGLAILLDKVDEWAGSVELHILSADVLSAFDHMHPKVMVEAMAFWGVHPLIAAALLNELLWTVCKVTLEGITTDDAIRFNRAIRQGGVEAPWLFNLTMRMLIASCMPTWKARGYGILLPDIGLTTHALWADNVFILAKSRAEATSMFIQLTEQLEHRGMSWKPQSLLILSAGCTSKPRGDLKIRVNAQDHVVQQVLTMEALGVLLCSSHDVAGPAQFRLNKATSAFWAGASFYKCRDIHIQKRLSEFYRRVLPVALYCSASWVWTKELYLLCYRWENSMLRQILGYSQITGVGHMQCTQVLTERVRKLYHAAGRLSLTTLVLHRIHGLAACFHQPNASRLTSLRFLPAAISFRDVDWWRNEQGRNISGSRHQRDGRPTLKWERVFSETLGSQWKTLALDRVKWKQLKGELVSKAYRLVGTVELEQRYPERKTRALEGEPCKREKNVSEVPERWNCKLLCQYQLLIRGDNMAVVRWLQGRWQAKYLPYASRVRSAVAHLERLSASLAIMPQDSHLEICEHVPRELNRCADELSKSLAVGESAQYWLDCHSRCARCLRIHFDGSFDAATGTGAAAWILECSVDGRLWETRAWQVTRVLGAKSSTATELTSALNAIAFLNTYLLTSTDASLSFMAQQAVDEY